MAGKREQLVTAEDLLRPGTPYDRGELWDGVWRVCEASGGSSEVVVTRACLAVGAHPSATDSGWLTGSSQGFLVSRKPDRVLSPDVSWTSRRRLPKPPRRGFIPMAPDLAVEVLSPDDRWDDVVAKAGVWIGHGTRVAWVIDPLAGRGAVLRPGEPLREVGRDGALDAAPALPGLEVRLAGLLAGLD